MKTNVSFHALNFSVSTPALGRNRLYAELVNWSSPVKFQRSLG